MIFEAKDQNCFEISNRHAIGLSSFSENKEGKTSICDLHHDREHRCAHMATNRRGSLLSFVINNE